MMDFMQNVLADRRRFRTLNVLDTVTRECLTSDFDNSLLGERVLQLLDHPIFWHGASK